MVLAIAIVRFIAQAIAGDWASAATAGVTALVMVLLLVQLRRHGVRPAEPTPAQRRLGMGLLFAGLALMAAVALLALFA